MPLALTGGFANAWGVVMKLPRREFLYLAAAAALLSPAATAHTRAANLRAILDDYVHQRGRYRNSTEREGIRTRSAAVRYKRQMTDHDTRG
jgi:hypothetical protein